MEEMIKMDFDINYFKTIAYKIFNVSSPTGYTSEAIGLISELLKEMGYDSSLTKKGNLLVTLSGDDNTYTVATSAHVDTLGLMVRSIKPNGKLAVTNLGGIIIPTLDGEYCQVRTREGKLYSGTILSTSPSSHVYKDANTKERSLDNVEIRLDELVYNASDVKNLGIDNGDFVFVDPKFVITESGFMKSRFIDDKASVCVILTVLKYMKEHNIKPLYKTNIYFVVHEEVGHGASTVSEEIDEFVTIDMGCVGLDLAGTETSVSIAAKDSGGPYDYELTTRLVNLAKNNDIDYVVDIFPMYGSDVSAAYRSGRDFKGALIGQGVNASHGMERTHLNGIINTMKLLYCYLTQR